jgi:translation initiation factor IF-1
VEVLPNAVFRVELANGHRILAHVARKSRTGLADLAAGDCVRLEMTPYDFSKGRITERV